MKKASTQKAPAKRRSGRPRITPQGVTIHPVGLTPETLATAKRLGGPTQNVSLGVRTALEIAEKSGASEPSELRQKPV